MKQILKLPVYLYLYSSSTKGNYDNAKYKKPNYDRDFRRSL